MFHSKPISNYTLILLEEFYEMTADGDSLPEINTPPFKNLKFIYRFQKDSVSKVGILDHETD